MTVQPKVLPPMVQFILTHRIPCAGLALLMFTAAVWSLMASGVPLLAALLMLAGMAVHLLTPALFSLILFGGGFVYAMQVAGIAAVAVIVVSGFSLTGGVLFLLLYAVVPILGARSLGRIGGLSRSARLTAIALFLATMAGMQAGAMAQGMDMRQFIDRMVDPFFSMLAASIPVGQQVAVDAIARAREVTVWALPGFLAFSLWLVWWMDILLGRRVAVKYGFYRGDHSQMLMLRFDKATGFTLIAATLLANFAGGALQYVAISTAIMLAGLLALQGMLVAHLWLRMRNMQVTLVVMYLMLFIWSAMIVPFIIAGLLDIWFDFRRSFMPANGEE